MAQAASDCGKYTTGHGIRHVQGQWMPDYHLVGSVVFRAARMRVYACDAVTLLDPTLPNAVNSVTRVAVTHVTLDTDRCEV